MSRTPFACLNVFIAYVHSPGHGYLPILRSRPHSRHRKAGQLRSARESMQQRRMSGVQCGVPVLRCTLCRFVVLAAINSQRLAALSCGKLLPCGHACGGIAGEPVCLPCFQHCSSDGRARSVWIRARLC